VFPATLFDFNGVLVDDEHVHLEAFRDTVEPLGLSISEEEYWKEYLGFDDVGAFEAILKKAGRDASSPIVARLVQEKRPHYMRRAKASLSTFEGAGELVRARALVGPVAIVSGALTDEIELGLSTLGVRGLVAKIISAEDTEVSKPDPEGYLMGVSWLREQIGDAAEQALVIEDSVDGIRAAKAAGLPTVAVAHSYKISELEAAGCDLALPHLRDLTESQLTDLYEKLYG
jgi:beta-phosphoglucomutase